MVKTIGIVSLSAGTIGEPFVKHEVELGLKRLENYGLSVKMLPHAMKGRTFVSEHPERRAEDLLQAFSDDSLDMIFCAIGGEDTYRLLPYLFGHHELEKALQNPQARRKIFLGFSDTTINHLMLHKLGLNTFYGQSFLADTCEIDSGMLPYSRHYFEELLETGTISEIKPSPVWYEERTDFSVEAVGTPRVSHPDTGWELLQGAPVFEGPILGGCIESLYQIFDDSRNADAPALCAEYSLFPSLQDWSGKILLLETSETQSSPELYRTMLRALKGTGIFNVISGIICGKPMDNAFFSEYREALVEVIGNPDLPVVTNFNIGHATPRCIIPFGLSAEVNVPKQTIRFR